MAILLVGPVISSSLHGFPMVRKKLPPLPHDSTQIIYNSQPSFTKKYSDCTPGRNWGHDLLTLPIFPVNLEKE